LARAAMTANEIPNLLVGFLSRISEGSVQVDIDSTPFASVDARSRNIDLQIEPLLTSPRGTRPIGGESVPLALWRSRRVPAELARTGWRVTLYDGTHELLALGRGTSALTGHVHLSPTALWKLRKLV
jgi:hypothetical protein